VCTLRRLNLAICKFCGRAPHFATALYSLSYASTVLLGGSAYRESSDGISKAVAGIVGVELRFTAGSGKSQNLNVESGRGDRERLSFDTSPARAGSTFRSPHHQQWDRETIPHSEHATGQHYRQNGCRIPTIRDSLRPILPFSSTRRDCFEMVAQN